VDVLVDVEDDVNMVRGGGALDEDPAAALADRGKNLFDERALLVRELGSRSSQRFPVQFQAALLRDRVVSEFGVAVIDSVAFAAMKTVGIGAECDVPARQGHGVFSKPGPRRPGSPDQGDGAILPLHPPNPIRRKPSRSQ
jgi:hypothetical protein